MSLDGTVGAHERDRRSLFFCVNAAALCLAAGFAVTDLAHLRVPLVAFAVLLVVLTAGATILAMLCRLHISTANVVGVAYVFSFAVMLSDLEMRTKGDSYSAMWVLIVDVLLAMQVPTRHTIGVVAVAIAWIVLMGLEESFRFGILDLPGLAPQEGEHGRRELFMKKADCVNVPCATGGVEVPLVLEVFVLDFLATRWFASSVMKEQVAMQSTMRTVQEIASLLAGYDVEGVGRLLAMRGAELPEEMHGTLQTLEANLRRYRPYLPAALFEDAEMDGGDVQHTTVPPPGLTTGSAAIVFTDIRASTSIWECSPDAMHASLKIYNAVMRDVMQEFGGYEVKAIGDAFMAAFAATADSVNFAFRVHERLLTADWPAALLEDAPICAPQGDIWGGLTVRIGVNSGAITLEQNPLTGRTDYFGNTVNIASRLERICIPGAVALPADLWQEHGVGCDGVTGQGEARELKGVSEKVVVVFAWPASLRMRRVSPLQDSCECDVSVDGRALDLESMSTLSSVDNPSIVPNCFSNGALLSRRIHGTLGVAEIAVGDEADYEAMESMNMGLGYLVVALNQSGGSLVTVLANCVCLGWNVTTATPAHMESAIRFAQRIRRAAINGAGLVSGPMHHGDVGARRQRFVTVMGATVRRSWTLCELAVRDGMCLYEPPEGTDIPQTLSRILARYAPGIHRVLEAYNSSVF